MQTLWGKAPWHANRLALDYEREAARLGPPPVPIIDAHAHINGPEACRIYDRVRRIYGVKRVYSQNTLSTIPAVKDTLGDAVRFIAFPQFGSAGADRARPHGEGYLETIETFHSKHGSRMLKLWAAPALRDYLGLPSWLGSGVCEIDAPWRVKALELGQKLGMMFMAHVGDPDTWFRTRYADASIYGKKAQHYEGLERMLDRFPNPWIAAHMGGWPEDLTFLDQLLSRHPNLHLDTSATRWIIRELSRHAPADVRDFLVKWKGRVLFGSDIVVTDDQLSPVKALGSARGELSNSPEEAFELYASRYWALRTMFETDYDGESNIADPDLAMEQPGKFDAMSAPRLRGLKLDREMLEVLYAGAAERLVETWWSDHGGV